MKTLFQINTVVNSGATGRITEEIGNIAIENGWTSYIAYGRGDCQSSSELIKVGTDLDVKIHGLQTRILDRQGLGSCRATKKLVHQIEKINPDIIHLHNIHGYYLNIEVLFNYLATKSTPIVWTFHDCWPMTGHCTHFDFVGCEKWKTKCFKCPQKKEYPASYGIDRSKKNYFLKKHLFTSLNTLTIVPVSEWLQNIVKQSFFTEIPVQVINNGINITVFKPQQDFASRKKYKIKDKFIILGVANVWGYRKGLQDFIALNNILDSSYQIILVGLSNLQINSLPSNIIGLPKTEDTLELVYLYSTADVFINLSVEETFGMTTIEAMACGTPAIVYNSTASPELITAKIGTVVNKGDIQGLASAVKLIKERGKYSYSMNCVERVRTLYNNKDRYQDYICLYNRLLDN